VNQRTNVIDLAFGLLDLEHFVGKMKKVLMFRINRIIADTVFRFSFQ